MPDVAIRIENVSKAYRIGVREETPDTLAGLCVSWVRSPLRNFSRLRRLNTFRARENAPDSFWALKNVSFDVKRGDVVGIIGRNGAGKSTLLKILSRIVEPTMGRIVGRGRVSSLLEVGTGFHPELTGRDNVYMNGTILGMTRREIDRKFDEIVDFSGVEKFLDTPVKRYSSGMQVRLAFAVAAHLEPEILIIDEVLAVGDAQFQRKCLGRMKQFADVGRTVLFVSHNMGAVRQLCSRSVLLEEGEVRDVGDTAVIIGKYLQNDEQTDSTSIRGFDEAPDRDAQLRQIEFRGPDGRLTCNFDCDYPVTVRLLFEVRREVRGMYGYLELQRHDGTVVLMSDSFDSVPNPLGELGQGMHEITLTIPSRTLGPGDYIVYLNFTSRSADHFHVDSPGIVGAFHLDDFTTYRGNSRTGFLSTLPTWEVRTASSAQLTPSAALV